MSTNIIDICFERVQITSYENKNIIYSYYIRSFIDGKYIDISKIMKYQKIIDILSEHIRVHGGTFGRYTTLLRAKYNTSRNNLVSNSAIINVNNNETHLCDKLPIIRITKKNN